MSRSRLHFRPWLTQSSIHAARHRHPPYVVLSGWKVTLTAGRPHWLRTTVWFVSNEAWTVQTEAPWWKKKNNFTLFPVCSGKWCGNRCDDCGCWNWSPSSGALYSNKLLWLEQPRTDEQCLAERLCADLALFHAEWLEWPEYMVIYDRPVSLCAVIHSVK